MRGIYYFTFFSLIVCCPQSATWQPEVYIFRLIVTEVNRNFSLTVLVTITIPISVCLSNSLGHHFTCLFCCIIFSFCC